MDLSAVSPKQRQKYLPILLLLIMVGIIYLGWKYFLAKPVFLPPPPTPPAEIKINFEILDDPILAKLQPFEIILPLEGNFGRDNPFLPY